MFRSLSWSPRLFLHQTDAVPFVNYINEFFEWFECDSDKLPDRAWKICRSRTQQRRGFCQKSRCMEPKILKLCFKCLISLEAYSIASFANFICALLRSFG
jgi:hypothetical protein